MKYIVKIFVITYLIFGINNAFAETKVVYVDMNTLINNSKAGTSINNQMKKILDKNNSVIWVYPTIFVMVFSTMAVQLDECPRISLPSNK